MNFSKKRNAGVQAILQIRIGSTRLPGKILMKIGDKAIVQWIIERLKAIRAIDRIVIATSINKENNELESFARQMCVKIFRGSEMDVLARFAGAIEAFPADTIIRATGDNPLLDVEALSLMIEAHIKNGADHTTASGIAPIGSTAEVVSARALLQADKEATAPHQREHVTPYIYTNPDNFRIIHIDPPGHLANQGYRVTLDTREDLHFLRKVYTLLSKSGKPFDMQHVANLLKDRPELLAINSHVEQRYL